MGALGFAAYPGVSASYATSHAFASLAYASLARGSLYGIRDLINRESGIDLRNPASAFSTAASLTWQVAPALVGGYPGAIADFMQLGLMSGNAVMNTINNFSSPNIQNRAEAATAFNASSGATSNVSRLWVTPGGAIITWYGDVISPAASSN